MKASSQESNTTFSDHEQKTLQESSANLSEEEMCFSVDNDTPKTLLRTRKQRNHY